MEQFVFERTMSRDEARKLAMKKNSWLWNIIFQKLKLSELRLVYFEHLMIDLETTAQPGLIKRLRKDSSAALTGGGALTETRKRIPVLYNGSTGQVALVSDHPRIQVKDLDEDSDDVQLSAYSDDDAIASSKKLAQRISHRFMGGLHEIELVEYKSVFRPYWVAFYGEVEVGKKVRYISIPADGGHNKRVR